MALLAALSVVTVVLGFAREATIAYFFGASGELDTFLVALTLPQLFVVRVTTITVAVVLPEYVDYRQADKYDQATTLVHRWFWFVAKLTGGVCIFLVIFAEPIVSLMAPGLSDESKAQSATWLRWLLPYVWLMVVASSFKVVLDTHRNFAVPASVGATVNLSVMLACTVAAPVLGITAMIPGFLVGGGLAFVMQWVKSRTFEPNLQLLRPSLFSPVKLPLAGAGIMALNSIAAQLYTVVDRGFASTLPQGSIAALNYANLIGSVPTTVVTSSLATALFPILASMAASENWRGAFKTTRDWINILMLVGVTPVALLIWFRTELVSLLFQRGQFDAEAVAMTASALSILPVMIILSSASTILDRLLLAQKQWAALAGIAVFSVTLKLGLNALLVDSLRLVGLALSTVLAALIGAVLRVMFAYRYQPQSSPVPAGGALVTEEPPP